MRVAQVVSIVRLFGLALLVADCSSYKSPTFDASASLDTRLVPDSLPWCRHSYPCPEGWFNYNDTQGGWYSTDPSRARGDGLCYQSCKTNSDCTDPRFPICGSLQFFEGSPDYPRYRGACKSEPELPSCASLQAGGSP